LIKGNVKEVGELLWSVAIACWKTPTTRVYAPRRLQMLGAKLMLVEPDLIKQELGASFAKEWGMKPVITSLLPQIIEALIKGNPRLFLQRHQHKKGEVPKGRKEVKERIRAVKDSRSLEVRLRRLRLGLLLLQTRVSNALMG